MRITRRYMVLLRPKVKQKESTVLQLVQELEKLLLKVNEMKSISTSYYVERQNLTIRMHNRRFTRLTNAFSKKIDNHCLALALHFVYYNFIKFHKTLSVPHAMEAGLIKRLMTIEDIVRLTEINHN